VKINPDPACPLCSGKAVIKDLSIHQQVAS
jgi:hypothetical protein